MSTSGAVVSLDGGVGPPQPRLSGALHSLMTDVRACRYEFAEFFVAWQGVLTVVFAGIPPPICRLKEKIDGQVEGVARENPGSKWPKTSLGCMRDDKTLTLAQLQTLRRICSEESRLLASIEPIVVDSLSVVLFANCCLERTIIVATTPLAGPPDLARPTPEELASVSSVLNEFATENIGKYHVFTSKPGNRSAHYRNLKGGATVVHFLKDIPQALASFRARVDAELPGMYDWFRDDSLHITVRALF